MRSARAGYRVGARPAVAVPPPAPHHPDGPRRRAADPFLLDAEQLTRIASDAIVRRGVAYFREHRVIDLTWDDAAIPAAVQGSRPHDPSEVLIELDGGEVAPRCPCPFDGEPVCKHVVASLLAYGARQPVSDAAAKDAADAAVEERATRARGEVSVRHVSGDAWFGGWEAWSLDPRAGAGRHYQVDIRSTGQRINHCTCPDFDTNRLGTGKHVGADDTQGGEDRTEAPVHNGPDQHLGHLRWKPRSGSRSLQSRRDGSPRKTRRWCSGHAR